MKYFFLFVLGLGAAAYFVWPTPYVEYAVGEGPYAKHVWPLQHRVNRLTHDVSVLSATGEWKPMDVDKSVLLRPDIIGTPWRPSVDASEGQRREREMTAMQAQADRAARARNDAVRK